MVINDLSSNMEGGLFVIRQRDCDDLFVTEDGIDHEGSGIGNAVLCAEFA